MEKPPKPYFDTPDLVMDIYPRLILHLKEIEKSSIGSLRLFYLKAALNETFDNDCIKFIRIPLSNLINLRQDMDINGLPIIVPMMTDGFNTAEDYIREVVLKMGIEASTIIPILTPYLFRCSIYVYVMDSKAGSNVDVQENKAVLDSDSYTLDDGLNFHTEILEVVLRPGHYDYVAKTLLAYDTDFYILEEEVVSKYNSGKSPDSKRDKSLISKPKGITGFITTPCCNLDLEKEPHIKSIISVNKGKRSIELGRIICPLCSMSKEKAAYVPDSLTQAEYSTLLQNCIANDNSIVTLCCGKTRNKDAYILDLKKEYIKKPNPDNLVCPYCSKSGVSNKEMEKLISKERLEEIYSQAPMCNICSKPITNDVVKCGKLKCNYHKSCFTKRYSDPGSLLCDCGEPVVKIKSAIDSEGKCMECLKTKKKKVILDADHGYCESCVEKVIVGINEEDGKTQLLCKNCKRYQNILSIWMDCCNETRRVDEVRNRIKTSYLYSKCEECGLKISDIDKKLLLSRPKDEEQCIGCNKYKEPSLALACNHKLCEECYRKEFKGIYSLEFDKPDRDCPICKTVKPYRRVRLQCCRFLQDLEKVINNVAKKSTICLNCGKQMEKSDISLFALSKGVMVKTEIKNTEEQKLGTRPPINEKCIICKHGEEPSVKLECGHYCCKKCNKEGKIKNLLRGGISSNVPSIICPFESKEVLIKCIKLESCWHIENAQRIVEEVKKSDPKCSRCFLRITSAEKEMFTLIPPPEDLPKACAKCEKLGKSFLLELKCGHSYCTTCAVNFEDIILHEYSAKNGYLECKLCRASQEIIYITLECCKKRQLASKAFDSIKAKNQFDNKGVICPECGNVFEYSRIVLELAKYEPTEMLSVYYNPEDMEKTKWGIGHCTECGEIKTEIVSHYLCENPEICGKGSTFCKDCLIKY